MVEDGAGRAQGLGKDRVVLMWGYLPGVSPLLGPVPVRLPPAAAAGDGWGDVCGGGCGFAVAISVKLLDWGEDGFATESETAALRASFKQEVAVWDKLSHPNVTKFVGASMGTTDLTIPADSSESGARTELPQRACCVVVEYLAGGTLKQYLIKNF